VWGVWIGESVDERSEGEMGRMGSRGKDILKEGCKSVCFFTILLEGFVIMDDSIGGMVTLSG